MHFMFSFILTSCAGWRDRYKWKISTFNHLIHSPYLSVCIYLSISIYFIHLQVVQQILHRIGDMVNLLPLVTTPNLFVRGTIGPPSTIGRRFNVDFSDYFVYSSFVLSRDANKLIYWCSLAFISTYKFINI